MNWILFLLIGLAAGWIAGKLIKGKGFGIFGNLFLGVVGALLGGFLARLAGLSTQGLLGELAAAVCGAVLLLLALRLIR